MIYVILNAKDFPDLREVDYVSVPLLIMAVRKSHLMISSKQIVLLVK